MVCKRVRVRVHGRVQGVAFREYTRREAMRLGLCGWVRNMPDGTVETVFEGAEERVKAILTWLQTGSPHAQVERVEAVTELPLGEDELFTIQFFSDERAGGYR